MIKMISSMRPDDKNMKSSAWRNKVKARLEAGDVVEKGNTHMTEALIKGIVCVGNIIFI